MFNLYLDPNFEWIPLAIRLSSDNTEGDERTLTKNDNSGDLSLWLLAKLWVQAAATNSVIIDDILVNHLLMEPVAVALERNLPSIHPLYKLLKPHLRGIPVINDVIRRHLLSFDDHVPSRLLGVSGGEDGERFWDYVSKKCQEMNLFTFDLELKLEMLRINAADDYQGIIPGKSNYVSRDLIIHPPICPSIHPSIHPTIGVNLCWVSRLQPPPLKGYHREWEGIGGSWAPKCSSQFTLVHPTFHQSIHPSTYSNILSPSRPVESHNGTTSSSRGP